MNHELTVEQSIIIPADKERVWKALTDPEIIKTYLYGTRTETDWQKGSKILFTGDYNGTQYEDSGEILIMEPLDRLSYSYWSGFSGLEKTVENHSTVTYTLKDAGEGNTEFTWTQQGFANENGYNHTKDNMGPFLESIKEAVLQLT